MMSKKEYMKEITLHFIYVDNNVIVESSSMILPIENGIFSRESLLQLIQTRKNTRYRVMEVLLYNIDVDNIHDPLDNYLTSLSFAKDNSIEPSHSLFHSLNNIYILFKNTVEEKHNKNKTRKNHHTPFHKKFTLKKK